MGLASEANSEATTAAADANDPFQLTYVIYLMLGLGYLLPWNAVDYFTYLYPDVSVDRVFSVAYMLVGLVTLLRINLGLALFVVSLLIVPTMDIVYIKGQVGFYVTVSLSGLADALVQGSLIRRAPRALHALPDLVKTLI